MKSIKPGRGPSMMGGVMGLVMGAFGVFWTIMAMNIGAPGMFAAFGVIFVVVAVCNAIYNFKNATGKNRHSMFDITTDQEEPDPLNEYFSDKKAAEEGDQERDKYAFCPYCGRKLDEGDRYCGQCGKKIL